MVVGQALVEWATKYAVVSFELMLPTLAMLANTVSGRGALLIQQLLLLQRIRFTEKFVLQRNQSISQKSRILQPNYTSILMQTQSQTH